jgi:hypothetical protein
MSDIIIKMTPFIFEDGNTYYFEIHKRDSGNDYHDLYVFKKVIIKRKFLWWKWENVRYDLMNQSPELIGIALNSAEIKSDLKKIIVSKSANHQIRGWDGFVGNVPEELKKSMQRDSKLNDLFNE